MIPDISQYSLSQEETISITLFDLSGNAVQHFVFLQKKSMLNNKRKPFILISNFLQENIFFLYPMELHGQSIRLILER
jgi:hypothetical protein